MLSSQEKGSNSNDSSAKKTGQSSLSKVKSFKEFTPKTGTDGGRSATIPPKSNQSKTYQETLNHPKSPKRHPAKLNATAAEFSPISGSTQSGSSQSQENAGSGKVQNASQGQRTNPNRKRFFPKNRKPRNAANQQVAPSQSSNPQASTPQSGNQQTKQQAVTSTTPAVKEQSKPSQVNSESTSKETTGQPKKNPHNRKARKPKPKATQAQAQAQAQPSKDAPASHVTTSTKPTEGGATHQPTSQGRQNAPKSSQPRRKPYRNSYRRKQNRPSNDDDNLSVASTVSSMSTVSTLSTVSTHSTYSGSDLPLRERLEHDLMREKYNCAICMDVIRKSHTIWSCPSCYVVLHIHCMKQWIFKYLDQVTLDSLPKQARESSKFMGYLYGKGVETLNTRCPYCRSDQKVNTILSGCFCGHGMINGPQAKHDEDLANATMPHSCGKICGRSRGGSCIHPCADICHPGACHPCSAIISLPCQCGREKQMVRCGTDPTTVHCSNVCGKLLDCKEHTCQLICHSGPCPSCSIPVECRCYCGKHHSTLPCGKTKMAMCSRNPDYSPDLMITTTATATEGTVNAALYNDNVVGDLDGLSDLSDFSDEEEGVDEPAADSAPHEVKPFAFLSMRKAGVGGYSCGEVCGKVLECQRHRCDRICHPFSCGICPYTVTPTTKCPCGKHLALEVNPDWKSCADPFPCCGEVCGKVLNCGIHTCPLKCHTGPCPTCEVPCVQKCRCTFTEREVPCWVLRNLPAPLGVTPEKEKEMRAPFICTRVCKTDLNCRRHKCELICCPHKGQKSDGSFHVCHKVCGKVLNCGKHTCYLPCHAGPCVPCGHVITEPITCACGKQVIQPPVPCGTPPPVCNEPCKKLCPRGHARNHTCHFGPCPPCTVPTDRMCEGGHGIVKGVPCYREKVFCNRICGKPLACGHFCQRTCHEPPCVDYDVLEKGCGQVCGKKREFCEHTCQALCHPDKPCPAVPCMFDVVVHCPCGRRSEVQKCLIGVSGDSHVLQDLSQRTLECDNECRIIQRNRRLAEALNVGPAKLNLPESELLRAYEVELKNCPYSKATLACGNVNPELVTWLETACDAIVRSSHQQAITVPQQYTAFYQSIEDVAKEYGVQVEKGSQITLKSGEAMKRPDILLSEAMVRFQSLVDGRRLHPAQPLPKYATERDFCTLFIHNRRGACKTDQGLLDYLQPYLPANQYKIRAWLRPDGLLVLFNTEETARRLKMDLESRDAEFDVDFWAVHENPTRSAEPERSEEKSIPTKPVMAPVEKMKDENSFASLSEH